MGELRFYAGKLTFRDLRLTGENTYINKSRFNETVFIHCFFNESFLCNSRWNGTLFADSSFVSTSFSEDIFFNTVFNRCKFNGAIFSPHTCFYRCRFYNCTFNGARIRCSDNMHDCVFDECDFGNADIEGEQLIPGRVRFSDCVGMPYIPMACPDEGSFRGYKIARDGSYPAMVKLIIPADAKRSSGNERKCRCDKAFVEEIIPLFGPFKGEKVMTARSDHDPNFFYHAGQMVGPITNFEEDRWITCAAGIHFFMNKNEALSYYGLLKKDNYGC